MDFRAARIIKRYDAAPREVSSVITFLGWQTRQVLTSTSISAYLAIVVVGHPSPHARELLLYCLCRTGMVCFSLSEDIQHCFLVIPLFKLVAN